MFTREARIAYGNDVSLAKRSSAKFSSVYYYVGDVPGAVVFSIFA